MKKAIALALALGMTVGGAILIDAPAYAGKGAMTNTQSFFANDGKRSKESQTPRRLKTPKNQKKSQ
ncbi:MAG: hypothetical protein KDJ25_14800 [Rhodoblastus sp.]|nr:hypothetical protein [Rhodoblastus sp.]